jgi:hypothetical protein
VRRFREHVFDDSIVAGRVNAAEISALNFALHRRLLIRLLLFKDSNAVVADQFPAGGAFLRLAEFRVDVFVAVDRDFVKLALANERFLLRAAGSFVHFCFGIHKRARLISGIAGPVLAGEWDSVDPLEFVTPLSTTRIIVRIRLMICCAERSELDQIKSKLRLLKSSQLSSLSFFEKALSSA